MHKAQTEICKYGYKDLFRETGLRRFPQNVRRRIMTLRGVWLKGMIPLFITLCLVTTCKRPLSNTILEKINAFSFQSPVGYN